MAKSKDAPKETPKTGRSTEKKGALRSEVATRARSIDFQFFGGLLPNPDPVLKKMGKDQAVYEEIMGDGHLTGIMGQRDAGVKGLLWDLDRGKDQSQEAKEILAWLKSIDMARVTREILEANYRGYHPLEVLWGPPNANGKIMPTDVVGKPPEWFQFGEQNELRFRTLTSILGEELPPRKFLLPRRNPSYKNPYGDALLSKCYWAAFFKRKGVTTFVTFVEKYGIPFMWGKLPRAMSEKEFNELKDRLDEMVQDATAAIPDDASIEIDAKGTNSSSAEVHQALIAWCDSEMSKAILGHGAGADSTPGKLGGEDNAQEVKEYLVLDDKRLVEQTMNQLIRWIWEVNYGAGEVPEFTMFKEEDVDLDQATRDKTLTDQGVEFTQEYYERTYNFQKGDIKSVSKPGPKAPLPGQVPPGGRAPEFAERRGPSYLGQEAVDDFVESLDPKELQAQADGFLKPIIARIRAKASYDDILADLGATFTDMDTRALIKMLRRSIFVAEATGKSESRTEAAA